MEFTNENITRKYRFIMPINQGYTDNLIVRDNLLYILKKALKGAKT